MFSKYLLEIVQGVYIALYIIGITLFISDFRTRCKHTTEYLAYYAVRKPEYSDLLNEASSLVGHLYIQQQVKEGLGLHSNNQ